jgi:hypothetical protein
MTASATAQPFSTASASALIILAQELKYLYNQTLPGSVWHDQLIATQTLT